MATGIDDEELGERRPLMSASSDSHHDDRPTATITHMDSVYSFILFVPPITRKLRGHYWSGHTWLALILLVLTVTCQVSLSRIAGQHIINQSLNFKVSLIRHQSWMSTAITPFDFAVDFVKSRTYDVVREKIYPSTKVVDDCCSDVDCMASIPCCAATNKSQAHVRRGNGSAASGKLAWQASAAAHQVQEASEKVRDFVFGSKGGAALCRRGADGTIDCSPPSYAYLSTWDELDANGDGIWTEEEAREDRANLGCRLGLSQLDFFQSAARGIVKDAKDTASNSFVFPLVPSSIEKRHAIPKNYFDWYRGIVVLCVAFDVSRCGQLVQQGVFDGAIGQKNEDVRGGLRGGIYDLDSALDYCQRMLRANGICEQTLPHTYRLYRRRTAEKCGDPSFQIGEKYFNPHDDRDAMSIVQVSFSEHGKFEGATNWKFQMFLALIILVWYVTLVLEISRIITNADFLWNFPNADERSYSYVTPTVRERIRSFASFASLCRMFKTPRAFHSHAPKTPDGAWLVEDVSRPHRILCIIVWWVRIILWWYMANVGTTFLLSTFDYDDLLFNAVALAFIFDLQELLYVFLVSEKTRKHMKGAQTSPYPTSLPQEGCASVLLSRSFWGLVLIPIFVFVVIEYNMTNNIRPSNEALDCACFQKGPRCMAAASYTKQWWDKYWEQTHALATLRASYFKR